MQKTLTFRPEDEKPVNNNPAFGALRILSYVVLAAMAAALLYAGYISLANWAGIAV
jgi:hypothetical protein